jgi:hypothetical protein
MEIKFKLIKISSIKMLLSVIGFIFGLIPFLFIPKSNSLPKDIDINIICFSFCTFILIFVLQIAFIKRYKIIGQVLINNDKFEIKDIRNEILFFYPFDKLEIFIEYKIYKDKNLHFLISKTREGIGRLEITKGINKFKYNFISEKNDYTQLYEILNFYEQSGCKIDLRKN